MIDWLKQPKREDTQVAKRRVWKSRCGHYKVEESTIIYGDSVDRHGNNKGYPTFYRAMVHKEWGWQVVGDDFRKRTSAMQALVYFSEHGTLPPKKKRVKRVRMEEDD